MDMSQVACPHCTFANPPSRVKCAMCLKFLRKKSSPSADGSNTESPSTQQSGQLIDTEEAKPTSSNPEEHVTLNLFQTAAGRPVCVSSKSFARASAKFADAPATNLLSTGSGELKRTAPAEGGAAVLDMFQTASGNSVKVSTEGLAKARAEFGGGTAFEAPAGTEKNEQTNELAAENNIISLNLFQTAAGKPVHVSKKSLAEASVKLANSLNANAPPTELGEEKRDTVMLDMFNTADGAPVSVSEKVFAAAREKMADPSTKANNTAAEEGDKTGGDQSPASSSYSVPAARSAPGRAVAQTAETSCETAAEEEHDDAEKVSVQHTGGRPSVPKIGSRRGFVPPRRAEHAGSGTLPAKPPSVEADKKEGATGDSVHGARKRPRFSSLEFHYQELTSAAADVPARAERLADVDSLFLFSSCCPRFVSLLSGSSGALPTKSTITVEHWQSLLIALGAVPSSCPTSWCRHLATSAVLQAYFLSVRAGVSLLSPTTVGLFLCQKYNREVVEGERPALRKMTEGDVSTAALSVLYLSSVSQQQLAPHTKVVTLSDGFYHLKTTLDIPLSNLIREGVLKVGQKLAVCGAKLRLSSFCSPSECAEEDVCFALNYNCVRPVASDARLGLCHHDPDPLCVRMVHPGGGMVPAIKGVVKRTLPPFFISQHKEGGKEGAARVLRNRAAHFAYVDGEAKAGALAEPTDAGDGVSVSKVSSVLLADDNGDEAVIQQWETCTLLESTREDDDHHAPVEGSTIVAFALNPSKANTSAAPFPKAKQFNCSRSMQYTCLGAPTTCERLLATCAADMGAAVMSCAVDFAGIFMDLRRTEQGTLAVFLLQDDTYALLQIPVASPSRVLSLGWPTAKGNVLFIMNGTFVSATDQATGSDCARVFANEYTLASQRLQHPTLQKLSGLLRQKAESTDLSSKKYISRCEDILSSASLVPAKAKGSNAGFAADAPHQNLMRAQRAEARMPYYLRGDHGQRGGTSAPKGVVICADVAVPRSTVDPPREAHARLYHFFGNLVEMKVTSAETSSSCVLFTTTSVAERPPDARSRSGDSGVLCELTWRFGKQSDEVLSAVVDEPRLIETIFAPVVSFEKIRSLIADDRNPEIGMKREEVLLTRDPSGGPRSFWWSVLTQSAIVTSHTSVDVVPGIPWSSAEWVSLLSCVKERLRSSLYKFSMREGKLVNVHFISDQCNVNGLYE